MFRPIRVVQAALLGAGLLASPLAAQQGGAKLAFVDSRIIQQRAPGMAEAQAQFTKEREAMQARLSKIQDSLKAAFDAYKKSEATLTPAQRDAKEKQFQQQQDDFQRTVQQMDQQAQQRQYELAQPIMNAIRETLDAIRNEDGYLFIFDVGTDGVGIVAADKNLDITDKVIARLKPVAVNVAPKSDSTKAGAAKPAPAGVAKPPVKPPTR